MAPHRINDSPESGTVAISISKPTVYVMDTFHPEAVARAHQLCNLVLPGTQEHKNWRQQAQYLWMRSSALTAGDIATCTQLRAIGKQGVGLDKIDQAACEQAGIKIFNTPGVNARAVAELVLTLTTSVARDVTRISLRQSAGEAVSKITCDGLILHKRTVGVLGMGNIGKAVAKIFQGAFESPVISYDPFMPDSAWSDVPHTRADTLEELVRNSDIITIHVPLTKDTRDLFTYKELSMMKKEAIIINASRGGIVNEIDLERALAEGLIWGAGLDCHEQEPPTKEKYEKLWAQRVVGTPHIGAATSQTQFETATAAIEALHRFATAHSSKMST